MWKIKNKTFLADALQPMVGQKRQGQNQGEIWYLISIQKMILKTVSVKTSASNLIVEY